MYIKWKLDSVGIEHVWFGEKWHFRFDHQTAHLTSLLLCFKSYYLQMVVESVYIPLFTFRFEFDDTKKKRKLKCNKPVSILSKYKKTMSNIVFRCSYRHKNTKCDKRFLLLIIRFVHIIASYEY